MIVKEGFLSQKGELLNFEAFLQEGHLACTSFRDSGLLQAWKRVPLAKRGPLLRWG